MTVGRDRQEAGEGVGEQIGRDRSNLGSSPGSATAPSGTANRAIGIMPRYKETKFRDPKYDTLDFRVEQYGSVFLETE